MIFGSTSIYWDLPVLLLAVSLVYSATRHDRWDRIAREAAGWILRMVGFLAGLGIVLYVLSTHPHWGPYALGVGIVVAIVYYSFVWKLIQWKQPAPKV